MPSLKNYQQMIESISQYHELGLLGEGAEGTVYLVEDQKFHKKYVLKLFHEPHDKEWYAGLVEYADKIKKNDLGLPIISLIDLNNEIIGVVYPYVRTIRRLHHRIISFDGVAKSIVGSYCQIQIFLISQHKLAIVDTGFGNIGVDVRGVWHQLDMGGGIGKLSNPWVQRTDAVGYGFVELLLSIYNFKIYDYMQFSDIQSRDDPCIYSQTEILDKIALRHAWVQEIVDYVRRNPSTIFYRPEFYMHFAERFPSRLPYPWLNLSLSEMLFRMERVRNKARNFFLAHQ